MNECSCIKVEHFHALINGFITAQTAFCHCTFSIYHCTFCASLRIKKSCCAKENVCKADPITVDQPEVGGRVCDDVTFLGQSALTFDLIRPVIDNIVHQAIDSETEKSVRQQTIAYE